MGEAGERHGVTKHNHAAPATEGNGNEGHRHVVPVAVPAQVRALRLKLLRGAMHAKRVPWVNERARFFSVVQLI